MSLPLDNLTYRGIVTLLLPIDNSAYGFGNKEHALNKNEMLYSFNSMKG